jgi:hypothetical protein
MSLEGCPVPPIFHLAAEYRAVPGVNFTMNQLMAQFMGGHPIHNAHYFQRTAAQVTVVQSMTGLQGGQVWYDDVSQVQVPGGHTPAPAYFANVTASVPYHQALFAAHQPEVVVIAGILAYDAFINIVCPALGPNRPRAVVRVRKPGAEGHRGSAAGWLVQYTQASVALAGALPLPPPGAAIAKGVLSSAGAHTPFVLRAL